MPTEKQSPVKRFPGHIVLPDFLNIRQVRMFQDAFYGDPNELQASDQEPDKKVFVSINDERLLPVLLELVQEWHIKKVPEKPTVETFPATPVLACHELIQWVTLELYRLYLGEVDIPND